VKAYHKKGDCHFALKEYHKALASYESGLKHDANDKFCKEGIEKTQQAIYLTNSQEDQEERAKKAMADPEIQAILQTPEIRNALSELERDPKSLNHILQNKNIA
jgi:stress-induced-phosphoprotein 1